jgi:hypothetical protein
MKAMDKSKIMKMKKTVQQKEATLKGKKKKTKGKTKGKMKSKNAQVRMLN